ncbi:MAG TPA: HD domain-containing protein [Solirubrobacteraceae bacterium]|nr:HD domain-containing protein [Solirubrobacteraceae bacterium]
MSPLASELVASEAERACLERLRELAGATDGPMEGHCVRCFLLAERMSALRGLELDRELLLCAALLHDIGIYPGAATKRSYVSDGADLGRMLLAPLGWPEERLQRCAEAIERHHELRPQWHHGNEVELLRRADLIELSAGLYTAWLAHGEVAAVRRRVSPAGFFPEIMRLLAGHIRSRPAAVPGIFVSALRR